MRKFIRTSFKREILVCLLAVSLLPLILSSAFLIQLFKVKIAGDYQKKNFAQETQITEKLDNLLRQFSSITEELALNPDVQDALTEKGKDMSSRIYSLLYEKTTGIRPFSQIELYGAEGNCLYSTGRGTRQTQFVTYWGILRAACQEKGMTVLREKNYAKETDTVLCAARAIYDKDNLCVGYIMISMNNSHFDTFFRDDSGGQDGICILDSFWENIYSNGTAKQENIGTVLRQQRLTGQPIARNWHNNSIYLAETEAAGLTVVLMRPVPFTKDTVNSMYTVLLLLAAAGGILCVIAAARMSGWLFHPLDALNQAMQKLQEGNLDTRITTDRRDEFAQLTENFNEMAKELETYTRRQVSQQKTLDDVQIAMMQAQLNPHFLYNTLDTMKWVAKANHVPQLATLSAKLAKILRTSISKAPFITLGEEIELVKSYAEIQSIRFEGIFQFLYEIEEDTKGCMIPKLILQPIVENAIIHGLSECKEGSIVICAKKCSAQLVIIVTDDGFGMDQDRMDFINHRKWKNISGHIGLFNVDTILRLHYGEGYGIKASRPDKGGCRITLTLPADEKRGE